MFDERLPSLIDDYRFALQVLQERSNLGLDSEYASKIRSVILEQIERGEAALNRHHPSVARVSRPQQEKVTA